MNENQTVTPFEAQQPPHTDEKLTWTYVQPAHVAWINELGCEYLRADANTTWGAFQGGFRYGRQYEQSLKQSKGAPMERLLTDRPDMGVCEHGTDRSTDWCVICDRDLFPTVECCPRCKYPLWMHPCET